MFSQHTFTHSLTHSNGKPARPQALLPAYEEAIDEAARRPGKVARTENLRLAVGHFARLSALELPPSALAANPALPAHYAAFLDLTLRHVSRGASTMLQEAQELSYCAAAITAALAPLRQAHSSAEDAGVRPELRPKLWAAAKRWLCLDGACRPAPEEAAAAARERQRCVERLRDGEQRASLARDVALCADCLRVTALAVRCPFWSL